MKLFSKAVMLLFLIIFLSQCGDTDLSDNDLNNVVLPDGKGFDMLSEYNFFSGDLSEVVPNVEGGVIPYDLNTTLFSDYALKKRFIYVPEGVSIPFDTSSVLSLPIGSVLIKHFYYELDNGQFDYVETRLLIRRDNEWQPETYEWNDEQTDAHRTIVGGTRSLTVPVNGTSTTFNYLIPNQNQCVNCHAYDGEIAPIGPSIHNLNKDFNYASGTANQIDNWVSKGILEPPTFINIPQYPQIDDLSASLNTRARAYLAVNCSSCHRREGSAANSGLYLEYGNTMDSLSLGFWKTPVAAGEGSGGLTYVIHPGQSDESILLYRMIADEVDERMPEIGRELLDQDGINLIKNWIDSQ